MDPSQDGGTFAASAPPVGGLGNFKGVMLCNRPSDEPSSKFTSGDDVPAFKSMVSHTHGEQIGLTPCRSFEPTVKKRGPSAALRRHVQWLRELQEQVKEERQQAESEEKDSEGRQSRIKAATEDNRVAVRAMMQERSKDWVDPTLVAAKAAREEREKGAGKTQRAAKPLWAMTEQEKDSFEEAEADDLINFAENLDFDKYIGDLEFRKALDSLKDRTGKLSKEQEAFKDALIREINAADMEERSTSVGSPRSLRLEDGVDGQSLFEGGSSAAGDGTRRRRREEAQGDGKPDWDSSTACGDEIQRDPKLKGAAERVLDSNSQIRAVHSKESVQRILEKAQQRHQEPLDLVDAMRLDTDVPVPVIVASADVQTRLHKPVDPSKLPYLYRSPAV